MINQSFKRIMLCVLTVSSSSSIFCGSVYWYNATSKPIRTLEAGGGSEGTLRPPKELSQTKRFRYTKPSVYYGYEDLPDTGGSINILQFTANIHDPVIIFEPAPDDKSVLKVRAISKEEFDKEYAQALKATQKKATPIIQEGTPLPSGVCGIVSEYYVEKPE